MTPFQVGDILIFTLPGNPPAVVTIEEIDLDSDTYPYWVKFHDPDLGATWAKPGELALLPVVIFGRAL